MKMRNRFPGVRAIVENESKPCLIEAELPGDLAGFEQQMTENLVVFRLCLRDAWNGLLGHQQNVRGGLGLDVPKGEHLVVLKNDGGGNFPRDNFLKQGLAHGS